MFSGYIEDGNKKAFQFYNPTGVPLSTGDYTVVMKHLTGDTNGGTFVERSWLIAETESDIYSIPPGGTVVMANPACGTEILAYLPNNQFLQYSFLSQMNGNDWLLFVEYDKEADTFGRVLDVIGDSRSEPGPWARNDENGNEIFNTRDVALSKDQAAISMSHNDYSDVESVKYWWDATQWDESMVFD